MRCGPFHQECSRPKYGDEWDTAVEKALEVCRGMLLILSPDAVASDNVKAEVNAH